MDNDEFFIYYELSTNCCDIRGINNPGCSLIGKLYVLVWEQCAKSADL